MLILERTRHDVFATDARTWVHSDRLAPHVSRRIVGTVARPKDRTSGPTNGPTLLYQLPPHRQAAR
jgi:hypothetical protein